MEVLDQLDSVAQEGHMTLQNGLFSDNRNQCDFSNWGSTQPLERHVSQSLKTMTSQTNVSAWSSTRDPSLKMSNNRPTATQRSLH